MRPVCQFCNKVIQDDQTCKHEADRGMYDGGWCHELCWWKRECARLTAELAEERGDCDGGESRSWQSPRNARHSFGSEPTQFCEFESGAKKP